MNERRYLLIACTYLFVVICAGILALHSVEGKSFIDALYLVVVCLTTVGLGGGVDRLDETGRLITIFLILNGVGVGSYVIGVLAKMIVGGELRQLLGQSYMQNRIKAMKDHVVICGYSDSAGAIIKEFDDAATPYLVIDSDPVKVEAMIRRGVPALHGDAAREEVLVEAGISRARALVANLGNDADNVFIVLTARTLKPDLFIVTRAGSAENVEKMKKVGADRVISPGVIGARRMAAYVLKKSVVDFMDVVIRGSGVELQMESITISETAPIAGKAIRDADIRARSGVVIVAIQHDENFFINPEPTTVLAPGDALIVMGNPEGLRNFRKMAGA